MPQGSTTSPDRLSESPHHDQATRPPSGSACRSRAGLLKAGVNTLRLDQVGKAGDPDELDDLGILGHRDRVRHPGTRPGGAAPVKIVTRSLVRHAHAIAREVSARAILLSADVIEEEQDLAGLLEDVAFRVILVTRQATCSAIPEGWDGRLPGRPGAQRGHDPRRSDQDRPPSIAAAEGLDPSRATGSSASPAWTGSGTIDTVIVLDLGQEIEMFGGSTAEPLPLDIAPAVFQRILTLASELGLEGREGRPVGTLFVLGDSDAVLAQSRQLVINPFHGYPEDERNILDARLEETIKEFSAIDGAFIVRGDGVILSAGRYLAPVARLDEPLAQGLGTRHEAAAAVTLATEALALCVSQSTGTVSIYRRGRLLTDIQKPRGRTTDGL